MSTSSTDTIFALSTAPGRGGIAVIRVSGPSALQSAQTITTNNISEIVPNKIILCKITNPISHETIDQGMMVYFKAPHSYTGEDTIEYHIHGGKAVIQELLQTLSEQPNHRLAEPGEFTRCAFENGKLDLTEAEAVADLIDAETIAQKNQALAQLSGQLSALYHDWTRRLKNLLAHAEAAIEFPDEDLPDEIETQTKPLIKKLHEEMIAHLNDNRRGERLRDGLQVAVVGAPNAGKSSLVNALARRDIAIVSDVAGTTRDVLEAHLDLGGYPVTLLDTAGLRPEHLNAQGHDKIENEGMRRTLERAENADFKILVFDATTEKPDQQTLDLHEKNDIRVINKSDENKTFHVKQAHKLSAKTGEGLPEFIDVLSEKVETILGGSEQPSLTRQRHRDALKQSFAHLEKALEGQLPELIAEDLRISIRYIGRITGHVDVEDLLTTIFADFCIGK